MWQKTTLGDISEDIAYGYTASAKQEPVGPKFLRITDISNGRLEWDKVPYCEISNSDYRKYKLASGDVVIARTGATTGATYTIKPSDPNDVVFASYLIRYRINTSIADPFFIDFCLRSSSWKLYVEGIAGGSAQPGANAKQLATFEIALPPLPEQKAIAEVLSSLDDKIDLLHRQNKTLESIAETLFRQWFIEETGEDWVDSELGNWVTIKYGKNLPTSQLTETGYSVFGGNGQIGYYTTYLYEDPQVLVSCRGEASGKVNISSPRAFITNNSLVLEIPKESPHTFEWLKYYALSFNFRDYTSGSAQPQITINDLSSAPVIIPNSEKILKFTDIVKPIENKREQNLSQIQSLEKTCDTLLPKLMNGEVRVKYTENKAPQDNVVNILDYIKQKARKIFEEKGYVDITKIANDLGIAVLKDTTLKKAQIKHEDNSFIIYSKDLNDNFSIAHELAHYAEDQETIKKAAVGRKDEYSLVKSKEKKRDALAAEFVMPEEFVRKFIAENSESESKEIDKKLIKKCARQFRVSMPAMQYRLDDLGYKVPQNYST